ncbi:MAG: PH domain-containing protein [Patescibacteria group bacterium]
MENYSNDKYVWDSPAFPQQSNPNEDIILIVRQDIAVLVIRFIATIFVFLFLLLLKFLVGFLIPPQFDLIQKFIDFLVSFGGLCLLVSFLWYFHNYYLSLQMVTTDRVIDIDQKGIFKREVNELAVSNIQDVTYKQNGLLPSMLGYGEVVIKTSSIEIGSKDANTISGFIFENCPDPSKVAGIISDLYHKRNEDATRQEAVVTADELRKVLEGVVPKNETNSQYDNEASQSPDKIYQTVDDPSEIIF